MKKSKKIVVWLIVIVLLIAGGILAVKSAKQGEAALPAAKDYAIVIAVIKPQMRDVTLTLPYLALTKNDKDVKLASRISARVNQIMASGSVVKKGDVIARLDNTSIQTNIKSVSAQIAAQETTLENLQATHQRTLDLLSVEGASIEQSQAEESKIAALKSQIESLRLKVDDLHNMLTYTIITSPVRGRISQTMVNTGDVTMPGKPLASISADNGFFLLIRVPADLKVFGIKLHEKLYDAVPLHSTFNGLAEYKVYVDNTEMTTGNRMEVDVVVYRGKALKLPFDAVLNRNGESYVLVKEGDKAVPKAIQIIQSGEQGMVSANSELAGKELVVAKQDILLRLLGGTSLKVKED